MGVVARAYTGTLIGTTGTLYPLRYLTTSMHATVTVFDPPFRTKTETSIIVVPKVQRPQTKKRWLTRQP